MFSPEKLKEIADKLYLRNGELYEQKRYKEKMIKNIERKMNAAAVIGLYKITVHEEALGKKFSSLYNEYAKVPVELFPYMKEEFIERGFTVRIGSTGHGYQTLEISWK